jgi:hypothetical protein
VQSRRCHRKQQGAACSAMHRTIQDPLYTARALQCLPRVCTRELALLLACLHAIMCVHYISVKADEAPIGRNVHICATVSSSL